MKKICMINYDISVSGGTERVAVSMANALAEHYEVFLISIFMTGKGPAFELDPRVKFFCALEKEERLRYMKKKLKPFLLDLFSKEGICAAIVHGMYPGWLASGICRKTQARLIFVDHEAIMNRWERKDLRFIRWYCSKKYDETVTLTESSRESYIKKFRLSGKKVHCIYNWIEPDENVSSEYDAGSKKIISAGRMTAEKGFEMLVRAMIPVVKKHGDWHLDIFGDGELKDEIEGEIIKDGLEENVHLCGNVNDLNCRYKQYAMYVMSSYREGMPVVLLEAKYNRLPIVSFDILTGPREIVSDGLNGILIEPYDIDKMSEAVNRLIEDDELRKSMSDHTRDDMEKFSKEHITGQWISLIEER